MRHLLLTCVLSLSAGFVCAQANDKGASFNLNNRVPEKGERVVITRVAPPQAASVASKGAVAGKGSMAPAMPVVPGSLPGAAPVTVAASAANPAPAPTRIETTNEIGGQGGPVKAYASMQEAAADGIDPLKVGTLKQGLPTLSGNSQDSKGFNWTDPLEYIQWAQDHPKDAVKYGGSLALALVAFSLIRRRAGAPA